LNVLAGRVEQLVPIEAEALEVQLRLGRERLLARVTRRSGEALGLAAGREVFAVIKTVAIDRRSLSRRGETLDFDEDIVSVHSQFSNSPTPGQRGSEKFLIGPPPFCAGAYF